MTDGRLDRFQGLLSPTEASELRRHRDQQRGEVWDERRADEVLSADVADWLHFQSGSARLLPRLVGDRRAGAHRWTLHQSRHSALTHLAEEGVNLPLLMAKSGHQNLRSLQRYSARVLTQSRL